MFEWNGVLLWIVFHSVEPLFNEDVKYVHGVEGGALQYEPPVLAVQLARGVDALEPQVDGLHVAGIQA